MRRLLISFFLSLHGTLLPAQSGPIPDVPVEPVPEGGMELDELGQTAMELVLNLQKFSVIAAGKNILLNNNADLLLSYQKLKDITDGNFNLHENFIKNVLGRVKDDIKQHSKAIQLYEVLQAIRNECNQSRALIASAGVFTNPELAFFHDSYRQLYREAGHLIAEYLLVITDGNMKANDGERILLILDIHRDAVGLYHALHKFNHQVRVTAATRQAAEEEKNRVRVLWGMDP